MINKNNNNKYMIFIIIIISIIVIIIITIIRIRRRIDNDVCEVNFDQFLGRARATGTGSREGASSSEISGRVGGGE